MQNLFDKDNADENIYFNYMKTYYGVHMDIMCEKGIYPYECVDSFDKMDYVGIPLIEAFRSSLKQETASKEHYDHVINVYET